MGARETDWQRARLKRSMQEDALNVSIIVKTLNEEKRIAATLESIVAALAGRQGEIIVADSGSTDKTVEIASRYPATIVQIIPPAQPSCGIGPQLGFQHSRYDAICLLDGDMLLDADFLDEAIAYLEANLSVAGVTGHVEELQIANLEFARRVQRNAPENRTGSIDRMNGGGLYRRSAIESVGYLSDRNLHGYEEFELGLRLHNAGWKLHRLNRRFVQHFGHTQNAYRLLVRRWKTKYLHGIGELLRSGVGKPYFFRMLRELKELRLWGAVYVWAALALALLIGLPDTRLALALILGSVAVVVALVSLRKGSLQMGLYTVVAWFFHAAALPFGFARKRLYPSAPIESRVIESAP
jgi:glycosyltransferase involved in cell wall biosynthesis